MFDSLKKKFSSWFGKKEESAKEEPKEEPEVKETPKLETTKEVAKKEEKVEVKKEEKKTDKKTEKKEKSSKTKEKAKEKKQDELPELPPREEVQEIKEEPAPEIQEKAPEVKEEKKGGFFSRLINKIAPSTTTLDQEHIDEIFSELEITLLENNVALEVVDKIRENLNKDLLGIEVKKDKVEETILSSLKNSILEVLLEAPDLEEQIKAKKLGPFTMIFFGINGSGKTTSIAKLASILKKAGISCVIAAGDTFRAASIEQLEKHGASLEVPVIKHSYGADPAAVAFDARKYAEAHKIQVVLIDTAGRMYTKQNLIKEMEKIIRVIKPDLKIFVGESISGNDAVDQVKTFNDAVGIDGIILTKADVDEKAGTILSVSYVTKKPIYFLGTGQSYDALTPFTKDTVLKNLGLK